jgi:hypothetical protein
MEPNLFTRGEKIMKNKILIVIGVVVLAFLALGTIAMTNLNKTLLNEQDTNLVQTVREATERYKEVEEAEADGYGQFLGCVSGREEGAMGVHYPNGNFVGDGALDPMHPEVLVYEVKNGKHTLVGVEYIVLYNEWHANNPDSPPVLGQSHLIQPTP